MLLSSWLVPVSQTAVLSFDRGRPQRPRVLAFECGGLDARGIDHRVPLPLLLRGLAPLCSSGLLALKDEWPGRSCER